MKTSQKNEYAAISQLIIPTAGMFVRSSSRIKHVPTSFCMRNCTSAVLDSEGKCKGCKKALKDHEKQASFSEWSSDTCTVPVPTTVFGKIKFPGSFCKTASYIRIDHKTEPGHVIQFLYDRNGWGMSMPQFIISVTGGAQNFSIPLRMRKAFKCGLVKAASSCNAWIITGGTNTGVMKLVGEAVAESPSKITVLGIASWGKIALRDELTNNQNREPFLYINDDKKEDSSPQLDPNHTHFILVDDGSEEKYGVEIKFRADLENELSRGYTLKHYNRQQSTPRSSYVEPTKEQSQYIPNVLIVVQGGPNTLKTVYECVINKVPVLVLADSKGCADLVANAVGLQTKTDKDLEHLIVESNMFGKKKTSRPSFFDDKRASEALEHLKVIVADENSGFINVFWLDSGDSTQDIELTILKAFLNSRKDEHYENLKLALKWNRSDIAKNEIFNGEETFEKGQLVSLLENALLENRPKFVEILLDNRVNISKFLTIRRLYFLYNSEKVLQNVKKSPLYQLIDKKGDTSESTIKLHQIRKFCVDYGFSDLKLDFLPQQDVRAELLEKFLVEANFADSSEVPGREYDTMNELVEHPAQNLFLWALLHDRIEIAKIFWRIGQHQICNALFASALFRNMSKYLHDLEADLLHHAHDFEALAVSILCMFDLNTDNMNNGIILFRIVPFYGINCLEMANEASCKKFVAQAAVQALLTEIWNGQVHIKPTKITGLKLLLSYLSFGLLAPFLLFNKVHQIKKQSELDKELHEYAVHNDIEIKYAYTQSCTTTLVQDCGPQASITCDLFRRDSLVNFVYHHQLHKELHNHHTPDSGILVSSMEEKIYLSEQAHGINQNYEVKQSYFTCFFKFMNAPRTRFTYDTVSYIAFLVLFSFMMLCEFNYDDLAPIAKLTKDMSNHTLVETSYHYVVNSPNWLQYLLIAWVISFQFEEIRQFFSGKKRLKLLLMSYLNDQWNYLDMAGCLMFSIGMALRFISFLRENKDLFTVARVVLCLDLCIWYVRLLHVSLVVKSLGPKLVMIWQMLKDLMFFVTIIAIFVCSFGVTTQATLYPRNTLNMKLFMSLIHKAYWPIYGEMKILDNDIAKSEAQCDSSSDANDCPESIGVTFSFFALMIYMVIANILLINLLIAMFSSTFQKVQANTDVIWKYQRYRLVFEYFNSPSLPQPLVVFSYIWSLMKKLCKLRANPIKKKAGDEGEETISSFRFKNQTDPFLEYEKRFAEMSLQAENERLRCSVDNKLQANSEKLEVLEEKLNEVVRLSGKELNKIHHHLNDIIQLLNKSTSLKE